VVLDPNEGKSRMVAVGSQLSGQATLVDVQERRVYLQNGNRNEFLELDTGEAGGAAAPKPSPAEERRPRRNRRGSGLEQEVAQSIRKISENKYEIERQALNKVLANTTLLARSARVVPSVRNGKPNGFKLFGIRPGSLYALLGMKNGDTLNAVNGHAMTTPDAALSVYTKLRNASHITISFERASKTTTNEYTIR
jgi:general secretion pathway protein C